MNRRALLRGLLALPVALVVGNAATRLVPQFRIWINGIAYQVPVWK